MKKVVITSLVLFFAITLGTSCKSKQSCPAYGKAPVAKQVKRV